MESRRVILDSNIFIAFYFENDRLHDEALLVMDAIRESEIIVPYCVIQEVTTILAYRLGKKQADQFLDDIRNANNVIVLADQPGAEIEFYKKFSQKIAFTDIALIYLAQEYNAMLFTFDQQLLNLYRRRQ